jgi:hypothetical protein
MNTKLSLEEIETALTKVQQFNIRSNIVVPNISWGFLNHEADMIVMSKSGYLTEIEIKRSLSDLKADFKKEHDHSDIRIKYFYYCVPESLLQNAIDLCMEHTRIVSGIITYSENSKITFHPIPYHNVGTGFSQRQMQPHRALFLEEQLQIARLGCMRIWKLKEKLAKHQENLLI